MKIFTMLLHIDTLARKPNSTAIITDSINDATSVGAFL